MITDVEEMKRWRAENGEEKRLNYNLNENSIVFDIGGYYGNWGPKIFQKFNCNLYVFEPIKKFYEGYKSKINSNKFYIFNYGLSNKNSFENISVANDGTSLYRNFPNKERIELKKISSVIKDLNVGKIDLMQINIEGSEYDVLDDLISTGTINNINNLQVQFHQDYPNSMIVKKEIIDKLANTHKLLWKYSEWIWESWTKS